MAIKNLPNVTLVAQDGPKVDRTVRALNHCAKLFNFAEVRLFSSHEPTIPFYGKFIKLPEMDYRQSCIWEINGFHTDTDFSLTIQHDGLIFHPEHWDDAWLDYDLIGPPWPQFWMDEGTIKHNRVGNMGICIRSRKFDEAGRSMDLSQVHTYNNRQLGDTFLCQTKYHEMRALGIKYAPVEVAARFGWEHNIEEGTAGPWSFGWHGMVAGKHPKLYEDWVR